MGALRRRTGAVFSQSLAVKPPKRRLRFKSRRWRENALNAQLTKRADLAVAPRRCYPAWSAEMRGRFPLQPQ